MVTIFVTVATCLSGAIFGAVAQLVNGVVNELFSLSLDFNPVNYSLMLGAFMIVTGKLPLLFFPVFFLTFQIGAKAVRLIS